MAVPPRIGTAVVMFIAVSFFIMILMLNLLIAIMQVCVCSDTFESMCGIGFSIRFSPLSDRLMTKTINFLPANRAGLL